MQRSQRGFLSVSGIFSLAVLATMTLLAFKLLPPYISNYEFQDAINNLALVSSYTPVTEEDIKKSVISKADSCGIELDNSQVSVHKGGNQVVIVTDYSVPVDLFVRQIDLHFEPATSNRNIMAK